MATILDQLYVSGDAMPRVSVRPPGSPDATRYHDAGTVRLAKGTSLADVLPGHGRLGVRGTVIPSSRPEGGSLGFDPHAPPKVFIDPEMTGGRVMVDYSLLSAAEVRDCVSRAHADADVAGDIRERGALAYAYMSEVTKKNAAAATSSSPATDPSLPPPAVTPSGSGATISPPTTSPAAPAAPAGPVYRPNSILADVETPATTRREIVTEKPQLYRVLFELPRPIGQFEARYHDVVRTADLLILVYDHNRGDAQHVWFPTPPAVDEDSIDLGVLVYAADGTPDTGFIAVPTPGRFTYRGVEFAMLAIKKEKSYREAGHAAATGRRDANGEARGGEPGLDAPGRTAAVPAGLQQDGGW